MQSQNIINGESVSATETLPFFDPTKGEQIGTAPDSDADLVEVAFQTAAAAFKSYKRTTPGTRQSLLLQLADLIEANADRLLESEVACTGRPAALTWELEILRGADQLRFFGGRAGWFRALSRLSPWKGFLPRSGVNRSEWLRRSPCGTTRS